MAPETILDKKLLEAILQQQVSAHKTPGLHYAFFDAEKVLFEYSAGEADVEKGIAVDAQTAFYAFSMTKTFTATATMHLVAQGRLQLDDLVKSHLPAFELGDEMTVRHLLAHSSGLSNPLPIRWIHLVEEHETFEEDAFFRKVFQGLKKPSRKPNERFAYTNLGFVVLGQIIETVSGMPYKEYIRQYIIQPLGVSDQLGFERQPGWKVAGGYHRAFSFGNLLLGFLLDRAKFMGKKAKGWASFNPDYVNGPAYGGLIGRPAAFVAFAQDLIRSDSALLSPESRQEMFQENHLNNGKASGMCLGWFCGKQDGIRFVTHAGGGGGYYCEMRIYPEKGLGSIIMTNRSGFSDERMIGAFDRFLLNSSAL